MVVVVGCGSATEITPSADADADSEGSGGTGDTSASSASGTSAGTAGTTTGTDTDGDSCINDAQCDDGLFCTGVELCRPDMAGADARGCISAAEPCEPPNVCSEAGEACLLPCEQDSDIDDDGFDSVECGGTDCDDTEPGVNPDATEDCDAVDDDCDPLTLAGADGDGDEDGAIAVACCNPDGAGGEVCGTDCNDAVAGGELGTWFDCSVCGTDCGAQSACEAGACIDARRVFITSETFDGNLGGESGADANCQAAAAAASLGGTWRAYLLQEPGGLNRHSRPDVPHIRLDGVRIADTWADLDSSVAAPLNVAETMQVVGGNAWTGMSDNNPIGDMDCDDWSTAVFGCLQGEACGAAGESNTIDSHWDGWYLFHCSDQYRLYCVEQ